MWTVITYLLPFFFGCEAFEEVPRPDAPSSMLCPDPTRSYNPMAMLCYNSGEHLVTQLFSRCAAWWGDGGAVFDKHRAVCLNFHNPPGGGGMRVMGPIKICANSSLNFGSFWKLEYFCCQNFLLWLQLGECMGGWWMGRWRRVYGFPSAPSIDPHLISSSMEAPVMVGSGQKLQGSMLCCCA